MQTGRKKMRARLPFSERIKRGRHDVVESVLVLLVVLVSYIITWILFMPPPRETGVPSMLDRRSRRTR